MANDILGRLADAVGRYVRGVIIAGGEPDGLWRRLRWQEGVRKGGITWHQMC